MIDPLRGKVELAAQSRIRNPKAQVNMRDEGKREYGIVDKHEKIGRAWGFGRYQAHSQMPRLAR